ncbi:Sk2 [Drosophila busckii]|uniref:sphingosine kinase n=1 Tax=Drosophila busckii TaxID=30019 RepID=A0A0M4E862_DROBS|nr:sphingosine kinase 1 [Drosophila busckii]ALC43016.1 Sk2 [Drosophila busckii]
MHKSLERSRSSVSSTPTNAPEERHSVSDTFYTSQRKGSHVFRVRLDETGFTLERESPSGGTVKGQTVKICDIVGARCVRLKKSSRSLAGCACVNPGTPRATGGKRNTPSKCSIASREEYACNGGDASAYLYLFAYVLKKKSFRSSVHRERTVLTLRFRSFDSFEDNMKEAERWYRALCWQLQRTLEPIFVTPDAKRRRVLVLLNPKSGAGNAREVFNLQVVPVLNESEVPYDLFVTKHSNYALEFMGTRRLEDWCTIIAVGGDGLFHEIINGLLRREDWAKVMPAISLGIIPCGSGNGLARSIAHGYNEPYFSNPVLGASLTVISGRSSPMDMVRVQLQERVMYSFLSIGWGLISDVDIESECIRMFGYQRFTIWTLYRWANLRTYNGRISYLLAEPTAEQPAAKQSEELSRLQSSRSCNLHLDKLASDSYRRSSDLLPQEFEDVISLETSINQSFRSRCDSWLSGGSRRSCYYSISESIYHSLADESEFTQAANSDQELQYGPGSSLPPLDEPVPDHWQVEQGEFIMMHAIYQTHLGIDCHFAPKALLNDGKIYLILIRGGISRPHLLSFLYNMSTGTHLPEKNNEFVKVLPVRAFRLEPHDNQGIITIDGERVEFGPLQAEILPGIARVMVPK